MKSTVLLAFLGALLAVSGCIKPEAENMEADILVMTLPDSVLISPPSITNTSVSAFVNFEKLNIKAVSPQFTLTEGASIQPASGTPQDFSKPVTYTVTSEDGHWKKEYRVSLLQNVAPDNFMFENWTVNPDGNYYIPYELVETEHQNIWASGNSGFSLIAPEKRPEAYPTQRSTDASQGTYAAYLETKSTGALGAIVGMPIAAGNLFLGSFDGAKALTAPLEATIFGIPFNKKPLRLTGSYKYVSGGAVTDKTGKPVTPERQDLCDIYAVLFKSSPEKPFLNGANVLTDPSVVGIAQLASGASTAGNGYQPFDLTFNYKSEVNPDDLASFAYKIVVVFSSSKNAAVFEGAVGSKLYIDDVKVVTQ
ncbi:Putative carbohydrate metabolism domain-containing protein [Dyadobacter sp. SG02]|uniref:PCMD domain-containing protein n=1 Tax=Dyadobacter sp. SG02 TaxID=1855291 RepID=UPI0008D8C584|nr:PCMD domain-containing protein [Dyadobacter sp. SG02]SEJ59050.1 Putative carbohydrate metabolism domain-containing protein [Dyadobacter sp. SG02]